MSKTTAASKKPWPKYKGRESIFATAPRFTAKPARVFATEQTKVSISLAGSSKKVK